MRRSTASLAARTLALAWLTCSACDKSRDTAQPDAIPPVMVAPAQAVAPPQAASETITDAALQTLLDRWLTAQNQGDFAAYEQLYAARFLGIKRAGARTTSFTRERWLKDRQRMFQKPTKVAALAPVFRAATDSAELSFTQRWASGTFEDQGPKRLLIVRQAGALKIAQEEMLSSELVQSDASAQSALDLHFTLALQSGLYMPLPEAPVPQSHGAIRAEADSDHDFSGSVYTSSAQVADSVLAPSVRSWSDQKVRLDDGCVATVAGFVLLVRVEPHFGTVQEWQGSQESKHAALTPKQIAEAVFALAAPVVAARLSGCTQGTFAQRAQTPVPTRATFVEDDSLVPKARSAFAKLKSVRELQARHLREAEDPSGLWWEPSFKLQSYQHPLTQQILVSVRADNGGICAEFSAAEWALFELRGDKLVHLYSGAPPAQIEQVLDVDADGRLELIVTHQSFSSERALISPEAASPRTELSHSYQDCPC